MGTTQEFIKGFKKVLAKHPKVYARIMEQESDFYDADAVIQYAVFGKWVYG